MEEEKLLRFLVRAALGCLISISISHASAALPLESVEVKTMPTFSFKKEDIDFADSLRNKSVQYTAGEILAKYEELKTLDGKEIEATRFEDMYKHKRSRPRLSVFVSSSMPVASLKAFSKEVAKYGATLVFKGLPNNSFQELIKLVSKINESSEEGSMQLDDEAFARFNITKVPTIVLLEEKSCKEFEVCTSSYDKVEGNISINVALEMFALSGDTSELAQELLDQ